MSTFTPFEGKYTNHIGNCRHPVTGAIYKLVTFHPGGSGPFNLQIWEHKSPYTSPPTLIRQWVQGSADAPGPFGYGDLECLPDGSIYIDVAVGALNATDIQPSYHIEPNCCAPFQPQGVGQTGPQGPQGPKGDTGPAGPAGDSGGAWEAVRQAFKAWLLG